MILRGVLGSCMVLAGGLVTSAVPGSSWVAQVGVFSALRESMPGRMLGLAIVVLGLGLMGSAWLRLLRHTASPTGSPTAPDARLSLVRWATVCWCLPLLLAPPLFSRDGWSYAAQGTMTHLGVSPYIWGPGVLQGPIIEAVDPRWMSTATPYGPLPLLWGGFASGLASDPWALVIAHRCLGLLGLLLLAYALPKIAAWSGRDPAAVSALVLATPLMLAHGVGGLHNDLVMVGLMAVSLVVAVERRWVFAAALGGAAAAVKLPGGLVCIGVALASLAVAVTWKGRVRRLAAVAAVAVGTLVAIGFAGGVGVGWVHALGVPGEVRTPLSLSTQVGQLLEVTFVALGNGAPSPSPVEMVRELAMLVALGLACWVAIRAPTGRPGEAVRAVATVMLGAFLLSPVVHHWYALWFVPFLAATRLSRRGEAALVSASILFGVVAPLDSSLEGAYVAIVVTTALVAGVAATLFTSQLSTARLPSAVG